MKAKEENISEDASQEKGISRRLLIKSCAAFSAFNAFTGASLPEALGRTPAASQGRDKRTIRAQRPHIAVIGAGAFGGWTALYLLRRGARVTLIDACGPWNSRASSGGETRVIRGIYGPDRIYVQMVARALILWRENEARWNRKLYYQTGALWMVSKEDGEFVKASKPFLREAALPFEELTSAEAARRYPQVNFEGVKWALHEKDAGYLLARRACEAVFDAFIREGGAYKQAWASP